MPQKYNYSDHAEVLIMLQKSQDAEQDQREKVREANRFLTRRDGQWDDYAINKMDGRFRGTFDMCTPIVDGIAGEIEQSDFTIRVSPSGGEASKDTAKTLDGLIRNIRNISNAEDTFNTMGRGNVIGGFDCCEIVQDFVDGDTFDQDLFVRYVPNSVDSVWFDLSSVKQDRSDAEWGVKLAALPKAEYDHRWPDGTGMSVGDNARTFDTSCNFNEKQTVTVGKLYYRKPIKIELVRMSDGSVYRDDEKLASVKDELAAAGITEEDRRTRDSWRVYSRMFDGGEWLNEEEETVFDFIPLVPIYGNYTIVDNNTTYFGKIENLYDSQRVLNYALSRDIEDGALSPSPAIWMTDDMAEGNDYTKMNVDRDPVRVFNIDKNNPGLTPIQLGGPIASQGLQTTIANVQQMINTTSNTFDAQQGNANAQQSGVAGLQQIEQGNVGNIKWFKDLEVTICHVGKILINAIPRVYDATRQVRILEEDGGSDMVMLNQTVFDQDTQELVTLNDLSIGEYDVVCEVGPAFNSAQKEAARSFEAMATIMPEFAQMGMDIWLKNKKEPGMDLMAERFRESLFNAGVIPQEQWTDEEQAQVAEQQALAAQQPPQPDPAMILAEAELMKGRAEQQDAANKQTEIQTKAEVEVLKLQVEQQKIALDQQRLEQDRNSKLNVEAVKIDQDQQKIDLQASKQQFEAMMATMQQQQQELNDAFANLKTMREAMGVDSIVGPGNTEAYIEQAQVVQDKQEDDQ